MSKQLARDTKLKAIQTMGNLPHAQMELRLTLEW